MADHRTPAADLPPITVAMTTWAPAGEEGIARARGARMTLATWSQRLIYEGPLYLHVADDGSALDGYPDVMVAEAMTYATRFVEATYSRQERHGVGASLNAAFRQGHDARGGLVLYAVDDWLLTEDLDLSPWARLLVERPDVGMVRLGPPHPSTTGTVEAFTEEWQGWALRLDRHHYAFGHRPALYHQRMRGAYGPFAEDVNAYDCERFYAERFGAPGDEHGWVRLRADGARARCGGPAVCPLCLREREQYPDIVLALPHPWLHVAGPEHAGVEPKGAL
jgi:hypothetical protein